MPRTTRSASMSRTVGSKCHVVQLLRPAPCSRVNTSCTLLQVSRRHRIVSSIYGYGCRRRHRVPAHPTSWRCNWQHSVFTGRVSLGAAVGAAAHTPRPAVHCAACSATFCPTWHKSEGDITVAHACFSRLCLQVIGCGVGSSLGGELASALLSLGSVAVLDPFVSAAFQSRSLVERALSAPETPERQSHV